MYQGDFVIYDYQGTERERDALETEAKRQADGRRNDDVLLRSPHRGKKGKRGGGG